LHNDFTVVIKIDLKTETLF